MKRIIRTICILAVLCAASPVFGQNTEDQQANPQAAQGQPAQAQPNTQAVP